MCLAILAPKGSDKNSDFLFNAIRTAAITNDDGAGYAYKRDSTKKVFISKGFMGNSAEPLIKHIKSKKLGINDELIVHLRIGNKGDINTNMCHPFVASDLHEVVLSNDKFVDNPVFIHNGTLTKYSKYNSIYSDTYFFAKDFASNKYVMDMLKGDTQGFKEIMDTHIGTSRFVFLFPNEDTEAITLGAFVHDNGYLFSNTTYKESNYRNVGGYYTPYSGHYNDYATEAPWEDYSGQKKPENKQSVFDFNTGKKAIEAKEANTKSAKVNEEPLVSKNVKIPDDFATMAYTCPDSGEKFRLYRGIWVPPSKSILDFRYKVNGLNYQKLALKSLVSDDTFEWKADKIYNILDFDFREEGISLHTVIQHTDSVDSSNFITVPGCDLDTCFKAYPKFKYEEFFKKYLLLVSNLNETPGTITMMSNIIKHLNHEKEVQFQDIGKFKREVFELYLYNYYRENHKATDEEFMLDIFKVML